MSEKIIRLMKNPAARLIFALISGCAYFALIYGFIHTRAPQSGLIVFFFCPAVICGAALVIIRLMRQSEENGSEGGIVRLVVLHAILILIAVPTAAAWIF